MKYKVGDIFYVPILDIHFEIVGEKFENNIDFFYIKSIEGGPDGLVALHEASHVYDNVGKYFFLSKRSILKRSLGLHEI